MRPSSRLPVAFAVALLAGPLSAGAAGAQTDQLSQVDRDFIEKAAESNHAEIDMGKTAAESTNPAIKAFGEQMIKDHSEMNQQLMELARAKGMEPPESADLASQAKGAMTGMLPGATFDKQYVSDQMEGHAEALALMQTEATEGSDPEVKALAASAIPIVEKHIAALDAMKQDPALQ